MIPGEILVVNDGSLLLQLMGCLLEARGYNIRVTDSPEEALILLNARNVNLAVMKLNGRQIDRLTVMHMIKEVNADTRLIIMAEEADLPAEIFEIEADDYILLPCRIGEIWRRLALYLEPSFRKPGFSRDKKLANFVTRQILKNLSSMVHEVHGQASSIARGLDLLKQKLRGRIDGEAAAAFQETVKRTRTLLDMTEDFSHQFLYQKPAGTSPGLIDLEEEVVQPAIREPRKRF